MELYRKEAKMVKKNQQQTLEIVEVQEKTAKTDDVIKLPLIGDKAPSFVAETTQGTLHFPEDYKGSWVILFSHPADFTPVCTTEFMMFAQMMDDFKILNTELIGLSVDSLSSHIAWLYTIQERVRFHGLEHVSIHFPLIADLNATIAKKYGMVHPNAHSTKTVRAVFFIDPEAQIRAILYYPSTIGRNFEEMKRILLSLQVGDAFQVSTPADWRPGEPVIAAHPTTLKEAQEASIRNQKDSSVWFLSLKNLSKKQINQRLQNHRKKSFLTNNCKTQK